jgi:hypothetical protein
MKKLLARSHEVASKQREHGELLDKDKVRMDKIMEEINSNKETAFGQFMELQMSLEQTNEHNSEQDMRLEKLADVDLTLESRVDKHDEKLVAHDTVNESVSESLEALKGTDEEIKEDVKELRDVELFNTNNQMALLMDKTEKKLDDIVNVKIKNMTKFCESMNLHLAEVSHEVKVFPEQIADLKETTDAIWKDIKYVLRRAHPKRAPAPAPTPSESGAPSERPLRASVHSERAPTPSERPKRAPTPSERPPQASAHPNLAGVSASELWGVRAKGSTGARAKGSTGARAKGSTGGGSPPTARDSARFFHRRAAAACSKRGFVLYPC